MPIGSYAVVPWVVEALWRRQPARVLDLGIGFGFWGAAVRQWLDNGVQPFRVYLAGVEGFPAYRNPAWSLYHHIWEEPIQRFSWRSTRGGPAQGWDFIICTDVIEHFTQSQALNMLAVAQTSLAPGGELWVSSPAVFCEQGPEHGNEFERHRTFWGPAEMRAAGLEVVWDGQPDAWQHRMVIAKMVRP